MPKIALDPASLQVTTFAPVHARDNAEVRQAAAAPTYYYTCPGTCNGCTSPQYAC
jgi:hypothetical protein